jgi:hypothetical protein
MPRHTMPQCSVAIRAPDGAMAGVTGLEPAASGVTGRRSNQLSYTPAARGCGGHSYPRTTGVSSRAAPV